MYNPISIDKLMDIIKEDFALKSCTEITRERLLREDLSRYIDGCVSDMCVDCEFFTSEDDDD